MSMAETDDGASEATEATEGNGETQLSEVEQRAMGMGWSPQDQYKGHAEDWVPAEEFIDSTPTKLRRKLRESDAKNSALEKRFEALQSGVKQMQGFQEQARQEGYERGLREARERLKTAAAEGDDAGVAKAEADMDKIEDKRREEEAKPAEPEAGNSAADQATFDGWKDENKWFERNTFLSGAAERYSRDLARENPNMPLARHLEEVTKAVKEEFPEKFDNPRKAPASVEGGGNGGGGIPARNRERGWTDLPADAKAAFAELVEAGAPYKGKDGKARYAKDYYTHNEE